MRLRRKTASPPHSLITEAGQTASCRIAVGRIGISPTPPIGKTRPECAAGSVAKRTFSVETFRSKCTRKQSTHSVVSPVGSKLSFCQKGIIDILLPITPIRTRSYVPQARMLASSSRYAARPTPRHLCAETIRRSAATQHGAATCLCGLAAVRVRHVRGIGSRVVDSREIFEGHGDIHHFVMREGDDDPLPSSADLLALNDRLDVLLKSVRYFQDPEPDKGNWRGPALTAP